MKGFSTKAPNRTDKSSVRLSSASHLDVGIIEMLSLSPTISAPMSPGRRNADLLMASMAPGPAIGADESWRVSTKDSSSISSSTCICDWIKSAIDPIVG